MARQGSQAERGRGGHPGNRGRSGAGLGGPHHRGAEVLGEQVMPAKASRAAFGEALIELGAKDERIVTVDADLSKSTMTAKFAKTYPARAFNLGIAQANMIGIGTGLPLAGTVPFIFAFASLI